MPDPKKILWPIATALSFVVGGIAGYMISNYQQERYLSASAFALKMRAVALYDERDVDKAIAVLNQSIALNPDDYGPFQTLGKIYYDAGRKDLALVMYETALQNTYKTNGSFYSFDKVHAAEYDRKTIQKRIDDLKAIAKK